MFVIRCGRKYVRTTDGDRIFYTQKRESALSFPDKTDAIHFCIMFFDRLLDYEVETL